jgi:hypothetical protein
MPKSKRSSAQVQADKDAKADEKRRADKERREGIVKAAAIENRMASDDSIRDKNANHPPPAEMEKILRPRPEKPTVEEEPSELICCSHPVYSHDNCQMQREMMSLILAPTAPGVVMSTNQQKKSRSRSPRRR